MKDEVVRDINLKLEQTRLDLKSSLDKLDELKIQSDENLRNIKRLQERLDSLLNIKSHLEKLDV